MIRMTGKGACRLAAAAACLVLLASCASRPESPQPAPGPRAAVASPGASASTRTAAAAAARAAAATGTKTVAAATQGDRGAKSAPAPTASDEYSKVALADYRCEILKNGVALAVKRRQGQRNATARIVLARDGGEESSQAGYDELAMATAARSFSGKGLSLAPRFDDWDEIALEMVSPPDRMADALALVAKALAYPAFANGDFEASLMEERVAERRESGDPFARAQAELLAARYRTGSRSLPPGGTAASLAAATREKVMRYWSESFVASRLSIVVVGDFDPETLIRALKGAFEALPAGKAYRSAGKSGVDVPGAALSGAYFKALAFSGMPGQALIKGEFDAPDSSSPDYPAMVVALAALDDLMLDAFRGDMIANRMAVPRGSTRGIVQGARTKLSTAASPTVSVVAYGTTDPTAAKAAIDAAIADLAGGRCLDLSSSNGGLASIGANLEAYKSRAIASTYAGCASSEGMAARIALDLASGGDGTALFRMAARIREVRAEDVARVARKSLLEGPSSWVALGDPELLLGLSPAAFASRSATAR
jgi:predicted Zn-dependent peptidase